jgi:tetratricopeptide (TPR) repeat protein
MVKKLFALALPIFIFGNQIAAQQTAVFTDANLNYKRGIEFYEQALYGQAQEEFKKVLAQNLPVNEPEFALLQANAELHFAKSAVQMGQAEGESLILSYIRKYSPDPAASKAQVDMANFYYNSKQYDKAAEFLNNVDMSSLSGEQRREMKFKQGYSYFVAKKFPQAQACFRQVKDQDGKYYYPANYYDGMCSFFDSRYDNAIKSFQIASQYNKYKPLVPYYICQIHFAKGEYDKLIAYAEPIWDDADVANKKEIRQLIGQAYFEKGNYQKALSHLEYFAEQSSSLREEEFYQLGFTQYKLGEYKKALKNFEEISRTDSKLGQIGAYYYGDCCIKTGNKVGARNAFSSASRMNYDKVLQEEANFNFGKVSYELKFDQDAITALQKVQSTSKYYNEAQTILGNLFLNTRDYARALKTIEGIQNKSPQMKEAYQKVLYFNGVQKFNEGNLSEARSLFMRSLDVPTDNKFKALATYGVAEIDYQNKSYALSISNLNQFLTLAKTVNGLPEESSIYTANYMQGYNYIKQEKYDTALKFFEESINSIIRDKASLSSTYVEKQVLGDASLRAGDCHFKNNKYDAALKHYNRAIDIKANGYVYAIFQKAIIEGLRGNNDEKLLALEKLVRDYPTSEYADEALLAQANTYQQLNQFSKAAVPLKKLVTEYKGKSSLLAEAYLNLGSIYYNQNQAETAASYYKQVFDNNPSKEQGKIALDALEEIYVTDLGKADAYADFLSTVPGYKVTDNDKEALNFKAADTKFSNGNYDQAITAYTDYLKKYPSSANSLTATFRRGESYAALKKWNEALKDYDAVVAKGQSSFYVRALSKGGTIAYNSNRDFAKAYEFYSKLEKVAPNDEVRFDAQLWAMRSAFRNNDNAGTKEMAQKVAKNTAATPEVLGIANFYIGKIAFEGKDYNAALPAFNKVISLQPDSEEAAEARYSIAYMYYIRRDLDTAEQQCTDGAKASGSYPHWVGKSLILLADIYAERGDLSTAQAALESVIDNNADDKDLIKEANDKLAQYKGKSKTKSKLRADNKDDKNLDMEDGN